MDRACKPDPLYTLVVPYINMVRNHKQDLNKPMVTLDTLISHLENLRDYHNAGELKLTVALESDLEEDEVEFVPVEKLKDINVLEIELEGKERKVLYLDIHGLLDFEK